MRDLAEQLRRAGLAEVDDSALAKALYSSDASLYRIAPQVVVRPREADDLEAILTVSRATGVPVTMRGAGTSIAGNAVGPGIVVDCSRHLTSIEVHPETSSATVGPGVVQAALQRAAAPHGLRFGPDPSTHNRCTIGGMIGNNACGSRALGYGRTVDNVLGIDAVLGTGERLVALSPAAGTSSWTPSTATAAAAASLQRLVAAELATIRTQFGRFSRQGSGYGMEHLLPERGADLARFLVGSEGTLGLIRSAEVRLVADPAHRLLVVLGYPSMPEAADHVPAVLPFEPTACEGLDERIVDRMRERTPDALPQLPTGPAWLLVELAGDDAAEVADRARRLASSAGARDSMVVTDPGVTAVIWRIREDGAGLASRTADGHQAHAGWEDAAVPVDGLGDYLRDFEALMASYGVHGVPYGHFGDGCIHCRIDFPLGRGSDGGRTQFRAFLDDAAQLVAGRGGSVSGEHGDGRARSALLPVMYSPEAIAVMGQAKALLDPDGLLNPGVVVDPATPQDDLRLVTARHTPVPFPLAHNASGGTPEGFEAAVHRCTGVGKCRAAVSGAVMCPSYQATHEEKDSTRGRARVLQELMQTDGADRGDIDWRAPAVHEALDLCLSCKGCARDCPTGIDMASFKALVLHQAYAGRRRPMSHYTLGRLPQWADLAGKAPALANLAMRASERVPLAGNAIRLAGVDPSRSLPAFAPRTVHQIWSGRPANPAPSRHGTVALWADTFTDHFAPEVAVAAVRVLQDAGYDVELVSDEACCGLTWISTGQLDEAAARMARTVAILEQHLQAGHQVVALEPSCLAALRSDGPGLIGSPELAGGRGDVEAARHVADGVRSLAELLSATPGYEPPSLAGITVVAQPHCHQHAVIGWDADERLLTRAGAAVTRLDGCCGLAGNWGVEPGHVEVSMAIAEQHLLPAVRALPDTRGGGVVLADGFSCRTQLGQALDDGLVPQRPVRHLVQLLDEAARR